MSGYDVRAGELLAWEVETGQPLPLSVEEILRLEDLGYVVDLVTGGVIVDGKQMSVTLGVVGEALAIVLGTEEEATHDRP